MPDILGGLSNLFQNNTFLNFLASAGMDMLANTPGRNLGGAVKGTITNEDTQKWLAMILGAGGKVNADSENVTIKAPATAFKGGSAKFLGSMFEGPGGLTPPERTGPNLTPYTPPVQSAAPVAAPSQTAAATGGQNDITNRLVAAFLANPSQGLGGLGEAVANFPASHLSGLTPEIMSNALNFRLAQEELGQKKFSDVVDAIYKLGVLGDYYQGQLGISGIQAETAAKRADIAAMAEERQWKELLRMAPLEVPGLGRLSLAEWNALDVSTKAYSFYAYNQKQKNLPILDYNTWNEQTPEPVQKRLFDLAEANPKFKEFLFEYAERGGIDISLSPYERTQQTELARMQAEVTAPGFFSGLEKNLGDVYMFYGTYKSAVEAYADRNGISVEEALPRYRQIKLLEQADAQIRQAFEGRDVERKVDGWYVDGVRKVRNPYAAAK